MSKDAHISGPGKGAVVLAKNLSALMAKTPNLDKQMKLAKAAKVAQTSISLMLAPGRRMTGKAGKPGSPKLSQIEAVAGAFGLEAWQLLIDPTTLGETLAKAMHLPAATDRRLEEQKIAPPQKARAKTA
jgi:hypothetical protein